MNYQAAPAEFRVRYAAFQRSVMRRPKLVISQACWVVLSLTALAGCDDTPGDVFSLWVRIDGSVVDELGGPVGNAAVSLHLMYDGPAIGGDITCFDYLFDPEITETDSSGSFTAVLQGANIAPPPDCVEVTVTPPSAVSLQPTVDTFVVAFSADRDTAPANHIQVELAK